MSDIEPYRTLVIGCPRHAEGHRLVKVALPARVDDLVKAVDGIRCLTLVREPVKGDPGHCDNALMFLRVEADKP